MLVFDAIGTGDAFFLVWGICMCRQCTKSGVGFGLAVHSDARDGMNGGNAGQGIAAHLGLAPLLCALAFYSSTVHNFATAIHHLVTVIHTVFIILLIIILALKALIT